MQVNVFYSHLCNLPYWSVVSQSHGLMEHEAVFLVLALIFSSVPIKIYRFVRYIEIYSCFHIEVQDAFFPGH